MVSGTSGESARVGTMPVGARLIISEELMESPIKMVTTQLLCRMLSFVEK